MYIKKDDDQNRQIFQEHLNIFFLSLWIERKQKKSCLEESGMKEELKKNWPEIFILTRFLITRHLSRLSICISTIGKHTRQRVPYNIQLSSKLVQFSSHKKVNSLIFRLISELSPKKKKHEKIFCCKCSENRMIKLINIIYRRTSDIRICNDHLRMQNKRNSLINAFYVT